MFSALKVLQTASPGFSQIYQTLRPAALEVAKRGFSTSSRLPPVVCTTIKGNMDAEEAREFATKMSTKFRAMPLGSKIDLGDRSTVLCVKNEDIELVDKDKYGQILVVSGSEDMEVRYGKFGVAPSASTPPLSLLEHSTPIPSNSVVVLDIQKHIPFLLDSQTPHNNFALASCQLDKTYEHDENVERYSVDTVCKLEPEQAKQLSLALQTKIFYDRKNEYFYEEVTSRVYKPTDHNKSSGTLMNFTNHEPGTEKATATHYHPGERSLIIVTTGKKAAVTLNFSGIAENPDERKDCEKHIKFPENSITVLNFPAYTHHKFHGEFDCMSVHPREGANLIKAVQSGTLPRGFLESATAFSRTDKDLEKWDISIPDEDKSKGKSNSGRY